MMSIRMNCLLPDLSILQRYEPLVLALVNYFSSSPGEIIIEHALVIRNIVNNIIII